MMGGLKMPRGFTIVEVMIVISISGLMLASAILLINGKTTAASFDSAINDFKSQIDKEISDMSNGFYPGIRDKVACQSDLANSAPYFVQTGSNNTQGTNQGCEFLGETLQFIAPTAVNYSSSFFGYPIIGRQCAGGSSGTTCQPITGCQGDLNYWGTSLGYPGNSTCYAQVAGGAYANTNCTGIGCSENLAHINNMSGGLKTYKMWEYTTTRSTKLNTTDVGFVVNPGSNSNGLNQSTDSSTGALALTLVEADEGWGIPGGFEQVKWSDTNGLFPDPQFVGESNQIWIAGALITPLSESDICVYSDNANESGLLTITQSNGQIGTKLTVYQDKTCT